MLIRLQKMRPIASFPLTFLLLIVWTLLLLWVQQSVARVEGDRVTRPFTIGFVLAIGLTTVLWGRWCGLLALVLSVLASIFVLPPHGYHDVLHYPRNQVETVFLIIVGGLQIIGMAMLRQNRYLRTEAAAKGRDLTTTQAELLESERRRLAFSREVLLAATGGRLDLCDADELRTRVQGNAILTAALTEYQDVSRLRHELKSLFSERGLDPLRLDDLALCITEAGTNAIKHGKGGTAQIWLHEEDMSEAVVLVSDQGPGISSTNLARATLERGFSTQASLGMGFFLMMESADTMVLSTAPTGTSILFRIGTHPRQSIEESLLASFRSVGVAEAA